MTEGSVTHPPAKPAGEQAGAQAERPDSPALRARLGLHRHAPAGWGASLVMLSPGTPRRGESVPASLTLQIEPGTLEGEDRDAVETALAELGDDKPDYALINRREAEIEGFPALDHVCEWNVAGYRLRCRTAVIAFPGPPEPEAALSTGPHRATLALLAQDRHFAHYEDGFNDWVWAMVRTAKGRASDAQASPGSGRAS